LLDIQQKAIVQFADQLILVSEFQKFAIVTNHIYPFIAKSIMLNGSPSFLGAGAPIPNADLANSLFILLETSPKIIL
jgi:hypothetical protein